MNELPSKNLVAKILCMIMAVVLWMYVMNEQNPPLEASFTIPLEVKNLANNYTLLDTPESVRVKVRGVRNIIATLSASDLSAYVDLNGIGEGRHSVKITTVIPASVELVEVNPDKALLRVDTTISRKVPVEVRYTSGPAAGAVVGNVTLTPDTVTVDGPKSLLDVIDKAIVQIDLSNHTESFSENSTVHVVNREGTELEDIQVGPAQVTVATQVLVINKKTVEVKPTFSGELPAGTMVKQITVTPPRIEVTGTKALLDTMDSVATEPIVLGGIGDIKEFSREVKVIVPDGVTNVPPVVVVKITLGPVR